MGTYTATDIIGKESDNGQFLHKKIEIDFDNEMLVVYHNTILALLQSSKNQRNKIQHSFNVMNCQHNHKLFHLSPVISCV